MKSDLVKKLLRALVTALGIGLGSVLAFVIVQLNAMAGNPAMSIGALLALYAAFALLLGLGGYLIAPRTIDSITRLIALVERCMDKMTFEQQAGSISGLVGGFIIAARRISSGCSSASAQKGTNRLLCRTGKSRRRNRSCWTKPC